MDLRAGVATFEADDGLRRARTASRFPCDMGRRGRLPDECRRYVQVDPTPRSVTPPDPPAGLDVPASSVVTVTGSHIRPQPGVGYDERRHVTVWGHAGRDAGWQPDFSRRTRRGAGRGETSPSPSTPSGRSVSRGATWRASRENSGASCGRSCRAAGSSCGRRGCRSCRRRSFPSWIGHGHRSCHGHFDLASAMLTLIGAAVQLGLNVANDVFDARLGADDQNVNPTQYSGGSRVIQYGLVSLRRMDGSRLVLYAIALTRRVDPVGRPLLARPPGHRGPGLPPQLLLYRAPVKLSIAASVS